MKEPNTSPKPAESVRVLLSEIIDYAGLFPPSQVSMAEAVLNYATYKNSNYKWMLGRFVVPAARLEEFWETASDFVSRDAKSGWRLSVIAGEDIYETLRIVEDFNAKNASYVLCDTLEVKANTESKIENTVKAMPNYLTTYFEIPIDDRLPDLVCALALYEQRAKIRTGGTTADAFPQTREIIRFIRTCMAANVPFKATAGLHHPLRCFKPLTYEANAPMGTMHGFLNVFLGTGFYRLGFNTNLLESLLEDEFSESFSFTDGAVTWHQTYILTAMQLKVVRAQNIISFGSCSFDEPITDLREIGLL
jgi:hypothetical protein